MREFLNYRQALALKKLGYNEPSYALFFNKSIEINFCESQLEKIQLFKHQRTNKPLGYLGLNITF